jgi:hypothetical protein
MNILLWYLPFTMFLGACDLVLSESERQVDGVRLAETAELISLDRRPTAYRAVIERG